MAPRMWKPIAWALVLSSAFMLTALGLAIAATAIPLWTSKATFQEGLWKYCVRLPGFNTCQQYDSADCNAAFQATRAFSIMGIVFCGFAACLGIALFAKSKLMIKLKWPWICLSVMAFCCTLICWVCWTIRNEDPKCYAIKSYGTSYILQIIASGFAFAACVMGYCAALLHDEKAPKYDPVESSLPQTPEIVLSPYPTTLVPHGHLEGTRGFYGLTMSSGMSPILYPEVDVEPYPPNPADLPFAPLPFYPTAAPTPSSMALGSPAPARTVVVTAPATPVVPVTAVQMSVVRPVVPLYPVVPVTVPVTIPAPNLAAVPVTTVTELEPLRFELPIPPSPAL